MSMSEERRWRGYMTRFVVDEGGCWLWQGKIKVGKSGGGYGIVQVAGRDVRVHVAFYNRFVGLVPEGQELRHSCDVRRCVNPEHLQPGTHAENMRDMAERGGRKRTHCPVGHTLGDRVYADGSRCTICRRSRDARYRRRSRAVALMVLAVLISVPAFFASSAETARADGGSSSATFDPRIQAVQLILRSYGYSIAVDGLNGPQTIKAVKHWQKANGLVADGIVGSITWAAVTAAAVRLTPPAPPQPQVPEPGDAATARALRIEFDLPDVFDIYSRRESHNDNTQTSSTGCCVGLYQIHTGNFNAPGYKAGILACGVTKRADILGPTIEQWRANTCVAAVLYRVSGLSPWRL